jgi:hypothetical protein
MLARARWIAAGAALLFAAFYFGSRALERLAELSRPPQEIPIAERSLRDPEFFPEDFGRKAVSYLYEPKPPDSFLLERLSEPRPTIAAISARYGNPQTTRIAELSPYGIRRRATVYSYGRLFLAVPEENREGEVMWVVVK